ncbi:MAG TPA: LPS export ABC transporter permease LptF [Rhodanobacteraceae bacterium]|nr:LPS export ABC transporter permease LptF [Rhodanobacteraceae bacterium]
MQRLSILDRYLLRELLGGTLAATAVLLVIFTGGTFADILNKVASGRLPGDIMFEVLGLHLVDTLSALLPMAMFLGILLALGRMYRDSEMQVLFTSGFGPRGMLRPAAMLGFGAAFLIALIALWLGPWATRTADAEVERANRSVIAAGLEPGRFTELPGKGGILFVDTMSPDGTKLGRLFVESERPGTADGKPVTQLDVITATHGELYHEGAADNRFIALFNGHRFDGQLGRDNWRLMKFARNDLALSSPDDSGDEDDPEHSRSTSTLIGDKDPTARAELQWRIATPFAALVLALLALPMARQNMRASTLGRLLIAVLAYLVFANLLILARTFIAQGKVPAAIGMWWVLVPVFAFAAWLFARQYVARRVRGTAT